MTRPTRRELEGEEWAERHRPRRLDDVVGHEEITTQLKRLLYKSELHHIIMNSDHVKAYAAVKGFVALIVGMVALFTPATQLFPHQFGIILPHEQWMDDLPAAGFFIIGYGLLTTITAIISTFTALAIFVSAYRKNQLLSSPVRLAIGFAVLAIVCLFSYLALFELINYQFHSQLQVVLLEFVFFILYISIYAAFTAAFSLIAVGLFPQSEV